MKLAEKRLNLKSIILVTIILPIVVILVSSIAIYITAKSVQPQATFELSDSDTKNAVASVPTGAKAAEELFTKLITDAVNSGILQLKGSVPVSIDSVESSNTPLQEILTFASSSLSAKLSEMYEPTNVSYGDDASYLLSLLPGSTPSSFEGEFSENDTFTLSLIYTSVFNNMYFVDADKAAITMFTQENSGVFSAINRKFVPEKCVYTLICNSKSGELLHFEASRTYDFSANISFLNTLSGIGSAALNIKITFSECFEISYAGIQITEDLLTLTENGYDSLSVIPYTEENLGEDEFTFELISSDPTVATVDENGQVEAVKESETPVEITAKLTYLGRTFTDVCKVYVVKEVERISVSETELSLEKGSTHTLSAEIKPDDATVKEVIFVSSDDSVASVDENGKITAKSKGTATITAVSKQGSLASECTVTVTE